MENQFKKDLKVSEIPLLGRHKLLTDEEYKKELKKLKELKGKNLLASRELTELFIEPEEAEELEK